MDKKSLGQLLVEAKDLQKVAGIVGFDDLNSRILDILHYHLKEVAVKLEARRTLVWGDPQAVLIIKYGNYRFRIPVPVLEELIEARPEYAGLTKRIRNIMNMQNRRYFVNSRYGLKALWMVVGDNESLLIGELSPRVGNRGERWESRIYISFQDIPRGTTFLSETELRTAIGDEPVDMLVAGLSKKVEQYAKRGLYRKAATEMYARWQEGDVQVGDTGMMVYGGGDASYVKVIKIEGGQIFVQHTSEIENSFGMNDGAEYDSAKTITIEQLLKYHPEGYYWDRGQEEWTDWCIEQHLPAAS